MSEAQPALPLPLAPPPLPEGARYASIEERRKLMKRRHPALTEADLDRFVGTVTR